MIFEMALFAIPLFVSLVCFAFEEKKTIGIFCGIMSLFIGIFCIYKKYDVEVIEQKDFSVPFLEYKINFGMTRGEIYNKFKKDDYLGNNELENSMIISVTWNDKSTAACFLFDEKQKLCCISLRMSLEDLTENGETKEDVLSELDNIYGEKKKYRKKWDYCWENTKYFALLFSTYESIDHIECYAIDWYEPNYFYENIDKEREINIRE